MARKKSVNKIPMFVVDFKSPNDIVINEIEVTFLNPESYLTIIDKIKRRRKRKTKSTMAFESYKQASAFSKSSELKDLLAGKRRAFNEPKKYGFIEGAVSIARAMDIWKSKGYSSPNEHTVRQRVTDGMSLIEAVKLVPGQEMTVPDLWRQAFRAFFNTDRQSWLM